jgi:sporulation protein YlmC with PRC-barrel domain
MAHYATLRDYQFDADVDDLRGATLYGEGGSKLARIEDVVFEHGSGNIEYLVAKQDHGRRVLIPVEDVRTSIVSDRDLDSDLTAEDLAALPAFEDNMLQHDDTWKRHLDQHRHALQDRNKAAGREYKREWTDDPVEHRTGDVAHTITPIEVEGSGGTLGGNTTRAEDDYVPDLTPQRLAPIFTNTAQTPDKLNMVPNAGLSRGPAADYQTAGLGVKWNGYQERIRRDLPKLRTACETCSDNQTKVA